MPYGDFLKMRIFEPLGMNDTGIDNRKLVLKNRASGYGFRVASRFTRPISTLRKSIRRDRFSTVRDLQKWDAALYTEKCCRRRRYRKCGPGKEQLRLRLDGRPAARARNVSSTAATCRGFIP